MGTTAKPGGWAVWIGMENAQRLMDRAETAGSTAALGVKDAVEKALADPAWAPPPKPSRESTAGLQEEVKRLRAELAALKDDEVEGVIRGWVQEPTEDEPEG